MPIDCEKNKVDEVVLALGLVTRSWKAFPWDALDRLHEKSLISNPKSRVKSVVLSDEAVELSEALFKKYFGKSG